MKGCLDDPETKLTERDARAVSKFRAELGLVYKLKSEGHSLKCAKLQVFDDRGCSCADPAETEEP